MKFRRTKNPVDNVVRVNASVPLRMDEWINPGDVFSITIDGPFEIQGRSVKRIRVHAIEVNAVEWA